MRVILLVCALALTSCGIKGDPEPRTEGVPCPFCD